MISVGWLYFSKTTASFVLCMFRRVKDHHSSLHSSPRLKKACARQVVLDKWFPLKNFVLSASMTCHVAGRSTDVTRDRRESQAIAGTYDGSQAAYGVLPVSVKKTILRRRRHVGI